MDVWIAELECNGLIVDWQVASSRRQALDNLARSLPARKHQLKDALRGVPLDPKDLVGCFSEALEVEDCDDVVNGPFQLTVYAFNLGGYDWEDPSSNDELLQIVAEEALALSLR